MLLVDFHHVLGRLVWLAEVDSYLVLACIDDVAASQVLDVPPPRFELRIVVVFLLDRALGGT